MKDFAGHNLVKRGTIESVFGKNRGQGLLEDRGRTQAPDLHCERRSRRAYGSDLVTQNQF